MRSTFTVLGMALFVLGGALVFENGFQSTRNESIAQIRWIASAVCDGTVRCSPCVPPTSCTITPGCPITGGSSGCERALGWGRGLCKDTINPFLWCAHRRAICGFPEKPWCLEILVGGVHVGCHPPACLFGGGANCLGCN